MSLWPRGGVRRGWTGWSRARRLSAGSGLRRRVSGSRSLATTGRQFFDARLRRVPTFTRSTGAATFCWKPKSRRSRTCRPCPGWACRCACRRGSTRFAWYGLGPHESYPDRQESVKRGLFSGTVQEQFETYVRPQENGNKSAVRWAAVTDARGMGLLATARPLLNVSVHHYTPEDLTEARHTSDLVRRAEMVLALWTTRRAGWGASPAAPARCRSICFSPPRRASRCG